MALIAKSLNLRVRHSTYSSTICVYVAHFIPNVVILSRVLYPRAGCINVAGAAPLLVLCREEVSNQTTSQEIPTTQYVVLSISFSPKLQELVRGFCFAICLLFSKEKHANYLQSRSMCLWNTYGERFGKIE